MTRVTLVGSNTEEKLKGALDTVIETTQDFTDSAYTSHQHRERILYLCERLRQELTILLKIGISLVSMAGKERGAFLLQILRIIHMTIWI